MSASHTTDLVIFDCDGVLVDSEPISNGVLAEMLGEQGLSMTITEARRNFQGLRLAEVVARAQAMLPGELPAGWLEEFQLRRARAFRQELQPVAEVAAAVRCVAGMGVRVCVASQGALSKTELTLALTGLRGLFGNDALFSAEQVPRGKPDPDLFLYAAKRMGVAPGSAAVVEDTPSGVTAAVAAGMCALGYSAGSDPDALRAAGARTFRSMSELPALLMSVSDAVPSWLSVDR